MIAHSYRVCAPDRGISTGLPARCGSEVPYAPRAPSSNAANGRGDKGRAICDRRDSDAAMVRA